MSPRTAHEVPAWPKGQLRAVLFLQTKVLLVEHPEDEGTMLARNARTKRAPQRHKEGSELGHDGIFVVLAGPGTAGVGAFSVVIV